LVELVGNPKMLFDEAWKECGGLEGVRVLGKATSKRRCENERAEKRRNRRPMRMRMRTRMEEKRGSKVQEEAAQKKKLVRIGGKRGGRDYRLTVVVGIIIGTPPETHPHPPHPHPHYCIIHQSTNPSTLVLEARSLFQACVHLLYTTCDI